MGTLLIIVRGSDNCATHSNSLSDPIVKRLCRAESGRGLAKFSCSKSCDLRITHWRSLIAHAIGQWVGRGLAVWATGRSPRLCVNVEDSLIAQAGRPGIEREIVSIAERSPAFRPGLLSVSINSGQFLAIQTTKIEFERVNAQSYEVTIGGG
jgi:hypothetical protein